MHQHGMLRAAEVSRQLCRKLKRLGLQTDSSCEGDVDQVRVCVGIGRCGLYVCAAQSGEDSYD